MSKNVLSESSLHRPLKNQNALTILFVENHDSFSWMIVDYLKQCQTTVIVLDNQSLIAEARTLVSQVDGIVLGPGPDRPEDAGILMQVLEIAMSLGKPLLGICLGMQAMGVRFGAVLAEGIGPLHGKASQIYITQQHPIFHNLPMEHPVGRYHSLVLSEVKLPLQVLAKTRDTELAMAISHTSLPLVGVQFHPESVLSPYGLDLIANWVASI